MMDIGIVALIVFAAGIVRGFSGFGFALAAAPLLAFVLPPHVIVPVVLLLDVGAGLASAISARRHVALQAGVVAGHTQPDDRAPGRIPSGASF